jgi:formylglycine-generating enzyme required for sulfatase activity
VQPTGTASKVDLGSGVTLMVYIAGGSFQMGSPPSEKDPESDKCPVHTVELDGFWMGKFEVTQAQYRAIMGSNPIVSRVTIGRLSRYRGIGRWIFAGN